MPVIIRSPKIAERAEADPLLYETLNDIADRASARVNESIVTITSGVVPFGSLSITSLTQPRVVIVGPAGLLTDDATLTFSAATLTTPGLAVTGLTNTYLPKAGVGGALSNSPIRTSGTDVMYVSTYKGGTSTGLNVWVGDGGQSATGAGITGSANASLGIGALYSSTTGRQNAAVGSNALNKLTTGTCNVALGAIALFNLTTGDSNVGIGMQSASTLTTGAANIAIGRYALYYNTAGYGNTAVGYQALFNVNSATAVGANTAIGIGAGAGITTGTGNTIVGPAGPLSGSLSNTLILAVGTGIRLYSDSAKNTGLGGITSPVSALEVPGAVTAKRFVAGTVATPGSITVTPLLTEYADIAVVAGASLVDGDYLTLNDGGDDYVFEYDSNGSVTPGRIPIVFTGSETATQIRDLTITAISDYFYPAIVKSATELTVSLSAGSTGGANSENVADAGFTVGAWYTVVAATTWTYKLVARLNDGTHSEAGAASSTAAGAATLSGDNFNYLTWSVVTGAQSYDVYRTVAGTSPSTTGLIGSTSATYLADTGLAGDSVTAPTVNTTGVGYFARAVTIGTTNQGAVLEVKDDNATCVRLSSYSAGYTGFRPHASAVNTTYKLPRKDGTNGYVLQTDGSGNLSWVAQSGSGGTGITSINGDTTANQTLQGDGGAITVSTAAGGVHTVSFGAGIVGAAYGGTGLNGLASGLIPFGAGYSPFGYSANLWWSNGSNILTVAGDVSATTLHVSGLTSGRVPYVGASGQILDTAHLVWDAVNNRLGVGTPVGGWPGEDIHIFRDTGTRSCLWVQADGGGSSTYAAVKLSSVYSGSLIATEWLLTAGNTIAGFEIRDTNAGATRLSISNTSGVVEVPQGVTVGGTPVKLDSMSTDRLLGRTTAGTGAIEEIVIGSGLTLNAGQLSAIMIGGITGSGTPGYLPKFIGATSIQDSVAQTDGSNIGVGMYPYRRLDVAGTMRGQLQDYGGQVFNVKAYGAAGDGTTNDTTFINNAITAAGALAPRRGVVFFPPGSYRTTGGHDLTGLDGLRVQGSGIGSTVFLIDSATNDLFQTTSQTYNLHIGSFRVDKYSTVTRTGGWVFNGGSTGLLRESIIEDIQMFKQNNGIKVKNYEFVEVMRCYFREGTGTAEGAIAGAGFYAGNLSSGGEIHFYFCEVDGNDAAGARTGANMAPAWGFVIDDTPGVRLISCHGTQCKTNAMKLIGTTGGVGSRLSGITLTNCIFDNTYDGASCRLTGAGPADHIQFSNCWFAGAGAYGVGTTHQGLLMDCTGGCWNVTLTGSTFQQASGHGIAILPGPATHAQMVISGCDFNSNGMSGVAGNRSAIHYDVPVGYLGPTVTGCQEMSQWAPGHQYSISCPAARTVRALVVGNGWTAPMNLLTAPTVQANNGPI